MLLISMEVDKGDNSCSREDKRENKCLEQLCRCIPHGAVGSRSLSGVTATAESTPGSGRYSHFSKMEVCVCACTRGEKNSDGDRKLCECQCSEVRQKAKH